MNSPRIDLATCSDDDRAAYFHQAAARAITDRADRLSTAYGRPLEPSTRAAFLDVARECSSDTVATLAAVLASARTFVPDNADDYVTTLDPDSRAALLAALTVHNH